MSNVLTRQKSTKMQGSTINSAGGVRNRQNSDKQSITIDLRNSNKCKDHDTVIKGLRSKLIEVTNNNASLLSEHNENSIEFDRICKENIF